MQARHVKKIKGFRYKQIPLLRHSPLANNMPVDIQIESKPLNQTDEVVARADQLSLGYATEE